MAHPARNEELSTQDKSKLLSSLADVVNPKFEGQQMSQEQSESYLQLLRDCDGDPNSFRDFGRALNQVAEMCEWSKTFPYGQNIAHEVCGRIRFLILKDLYRAFIRQNRCARPQIPIIPPSIPREIGTPPSPSPGYQNLKNAFENVVAGAILFETWAKWDVYTLVAREDDIWYQLQHLGREWQPRDEWENEIVDLRNMLNTGVEVGALNTSDEQRPCLNFFLQDNPLIFHQSTMVNHCLGYMRKFAAEVPFGKTTIRKVIENLSDNFTGSDLRDERVPERAVETLCQRLRKQFAAELDHRQKIRQSKATLEDIKKLIAHDSFYFGKEIALLRCERLGRDLALEETRQIYQPPSKSRDMTVDTFWIISEAHRVLSQRLQDDSVEWVAKEDAIWCDLYRFGGKRSRPPVKSRAWIEDVLTCAREQSLYEVHHMDVRNKAKKKAAKSLRNLALLSDKPELRDALEDVASKISTVDMSESSLDASVKTSLAVKDAISTATEAYSVFEHWSKYDRITWVAREHHVWNDMHRLGRGRWEGKVRNLDWAKEVLQFAEKVETVEPAASSGATKEQAAVSLRRLSQHDNVPSEISTRLIATAVKYGDSSELPQELRIRLDDSQLDLENAAPNTQGGSANVYFGSYRIYGKPRQIAIKMFRLDKNYKPYDKIKSEFSQEAWTWRELSKTGCPYVVKFYGADIHAMTRLRLVSEWMVNGNIVEYLNCSPERTELIKCTMIHRIVLAISWVHSKGFVHADIKGANILVDEGGNPRLADFGISHLVHISSHEADAENYPYADIASSTSTSSSSASQPSPIVGSIRWMAPERFFHRSSRPTKESDVYAFGYLVFQIFANNVPFHEKHSIREILDEHCYWSIRNPAELAALRPPSLESDVLWVIVTRCIRWNPTSRPRMIGLKKEMKDLCESLEKSSSVGRKLVDL